MIHSLADMAVVVVLILLGLSSFTVRPEDIPEFQYPCYVDICTFPTHFCNSDRFERRCSPCTRAICRESKVPLACKYICKKYETPPKTTTTLVPTAKSSHDDSSKNAYCTPSFMLLGYSAISTTIIVILLAVILVCVLRKQTKLDNKNNKLCQAQRSFKSGLVQDDEQQQRLLDTVVTKLEEGGANNIVQGREVPVNDSPPSYTTRSSGGDEESAGTPVQAGCCVRQVCSTYLTNPTADQNENQHEKPWVPNRQNAANQDTQFPNQPSTSEIDNNRGGDEPLNNASEMTLPRSLASTGGQRSLQADIAMGSINRHNDELTEVVERTDEDSVSEETSLKS